jgi:multidrug efflux pump subunit AcrA (membrane-fusion protein)
MSTITKKWNRDFTLADEIGGDFPALLLVRSSRWIRKLAQYTLFGLLLSIIAMLALPWQQTSKGTGTVSALNPQERPQEVKSQYDGIVKRIAEGMNEGRRVHEGEFILELEPTSREEIAQTDGNLQLLAEQLRAEQSEYELYKLQVELSESTRDANIEKQTLAIESANYKLQEKDSLIRKYNVELELAKLNRQQSDRLKAVGVEAGLDNAAYRTKEKSLLEELAAHNQSRSAIEAEIREKEADLEKITAEGNDKVASAKTKVQSAFGKLQITQQKINDTKIKRGSLDRLIQEAPCDGVIYRLVTAEGASTVKEGDELFTIVPDVEELAVELVVSGNDTSFIREGQEVRLQFEGWPAVQFMGWPSLAVGTFGGRVKMIDKFSEGAGKFRILVVPDGESEWPKDLLRQGMRANGWVMLNQVTLGFEIWRQLNGFPPSVDEQKSSDEEKGKKIKLPK